MNLGLNLLGLAQRAGKLASGEQTVLQNIRNQNAKLVLLCSDASDNTQKNIRDKCNFYHIELRVVYTSDQLSAALGKKRFVCALLDSGFSKRMDEIIQG
ncbi:L7Ae/L30e/S12e/Gadd45 family ribosomal protein [Enterococcus timonensis]|uniref:L7Ae/L30e/S12e/Gadd45 family ribosomal protein n=1 Tax=Enterococcus timonensis TaxID=1852364 RepID=UPI0008DAC985|nr:ribosomal L7Ae/L30e/S12e/Gadd45 family protein [Enterococcus timonensis]